MKRPSSNNRVKSKERHSTLTRGPKVLSLLFAQLAVEAIIKKMVSIEHRMENDDLNLTKLRLFLFKQ